MDKQKNKLHFRRFEFKYLLPPELVGEIRQDIKHFLKLDPYAKEKESSADAMSGSASFLSGRRGNGILPAPCTKGRGVRLPSVAASLPPNRRKIRRQENQGYWASTVYLDNYKLSCFWEKTDGLFARKKARFRVYGKKRDSAIFLELKRKRGDIILKDRVVVKKEKIPLVFEGNLDYLLEFAKDKNTDFELMKEYMAFKQERRLIPMILVTYFRQAFISDYEDLRMTLDSQIKVSQLRDFSFFQDADREKELLSPMDKVTVLELKFTGSLPYWLYHLLKKYNLKRESFSKYCQGIEAVFNIVL